MLCRFAVGGEGCAAPIEDSDRRCSEAIDSRFLRREDVFAAPHRFADSEFAKHVRRFGEVLSARALNASRDRQLSRQDTDE